MRVEFDRFEAAAARKCEIRYATHAFFSDIVLEFIRINSLMCVLCFYMLLSLVYILFAFLTAIFIAYAIVLYLYN